MKNIQFIIPNIARQTSAYNWDEFPYALQSIIDEVNNIIIPQILDEEAIINLKVLNITLEATLQKAKDEWVKLMAIKKCKKRIEMVLPTKTAPINDSY